MIRKSLFDVVGVFDESLPACEDYDLCQRVRNIGHRIGVVPGARILHYSGSVTNTPGRERKRMRQILRNRTIYRLRFETDAPLRTLLVVLLMEFPRRAVRRILRRKGSQSLRSIAAAFGDLLMLGGRLANRENDRNQWDQYLEEIEWASLGSRFESSELEGPASRE